jgi:predicted kinase
MLVGLPGTGKSYLARLLVERLRAELIQTDVLRKAMFRQPRYTADEHAAVYAESHRRIKRQLLRGRTLVFDATNLEESKREIVYGLANDAEAELLVVSCYAPIDLVQQRLSGRSSRLDPFDRSDADWEVYRKLGRADPITRPHLVVNSAVDLAQVVELIAARLRSTIDD